MDENIVRQKMQAVVSATSEDIASIRTGRASPSLVENLEVSVYGGQQRLRILELGSITMPDPQMIVIDPWDKSIIGEINKGINILNIGLSSNIDGEVIRIPIPPLTTEDKEKFVKILSGRLENARVAIRQVRADVMHDIKKSFEAKELSEDERRDQEKLVQELTDEYVKKIEEVGKKKEIELMQV